jgi:hypothetical protein
VFIVTASSPKEVKLFAFFSPLIGSGRRCKFNPRVLHFGKKEQKFGRNFKDAEIMSRLKRGMF